MIPSKVDFGENLDERLARWENRSIGAKQPTGKSPHIKEKVMIALSKNDIRNLIATNDRAVERALLVMLNRQTADEARGNTTKKANGIGYNKRDAPFGTDLGKKLKMGVRLSPRQIQCARAMLLKYSGQLLDEAEMKAARERLPF